MYAAAAPAFQPEAVAIAAAPCENVADLFGRFVDYLDVAPKTAATYGRAVQAFLRWLAQNGIALPRREDVRAYRDELAAGHKPGTVRAYLSALKIFFEWTDDEGLYPNVAKRVKAGRIDSSPKKAALTAAQVHAVLENARAAGDGEAALRDYAILVILFTAGLRGIEIRRLDVADFHTEGDVPGLYVQGKGHLEKDAFQNLQPEAVAAVNAYLAKRGPVAPDAPLFASTSNNSRGGRLSTVSLSCMAKAAFRRIGLDSPLYTLHGTRHTAISLSCQAGLPVREVAKFARHASTRTTEIYIHELEKRRNRCGAAIAAQIF